MSGKKKEEIGFEENLTKLEDIVSSLENGDLKLDESLTLFEEGIKLVKLCQKKLENAERRVEILLKDEEGNIKIEDYKE